MNATTRATISRRHLSPAHPGSGRLSRSPSVWDLRLTVGPCRRFARASLSWGSTLCLAILAILAGCGDGGTKPPQAPVVRVLSPNGGEQLLYGTSHAITWTATDADTPAASLRVTIEYTFDGGNLWIPIASDESNDGQYDWVVPQLSSFTARVRLTVSDGQSSAQDESDANFSLVYNPPPPPAAQELSVGSASGAPFTQATVPLALDNDTAAIDLETTLAFDPAVLEFVSAAAVGRGLAFPFAAAVQNPGRLLVRFQVQGQSRFEPGDGDIARVTFRLIGAGGTQSSVTPQSTRLLGVDNNPLNVRNISGTITVLNVDTPETLTRDGWIRFEAGDFAGGLAKFDQAIALDPQYGPAHVGRGWSKLQLATSTDGFQEAVTAFNAAIAGQQTGADARAGRAAALLALGGGQLQAAVEEAGRAAQADPQFVFAHRTSFDLTDIRLIEAFAQAGRGQMTSARDAADRIAPSGIRAGDANTWVVDGVRYPSFEAAVLAFLQKMSNQHAG